MPARSVVTDGGNKVRYSRLATDDDGYIDLQFKKSPPKVPYKAIALATALFLIGSVLIIVGSLLLAGYFGVTHSDRTIPVLIIGILVFLPGFYHLRIAYYASEGCPGYSYDDIPDFDIPAQRVPLAHIDFSENYSCKYSEEIQSVRFGGSHKQVSLHTGALYTTGEQAPQTFCSISASRRHDPVAIWAHLDPVLKVVRERHPQVSILHFVQ